MYPVHPYYPPPSHSHTQPQPQPQPQPKPQLTNHTNQTRYSTIAKSIGLNKNPFTEEYRILINLVKGIQKKEYSGKNLKDINITQFVKNNIAILKEINPYYAKSKQTIKADSSITTKVKQLLFDPSSTTTDKETRKQLRKIFRDILTKDLIEHTETLDWSFCLQALVLTRYMDKRNKRERNEENDDDDDDDRPLKISKQHTVSKDIKPDENVTLKDIKQDEHMALTNINGTLKDENATVKDTNATLRVESDSCTDENVALRDENTTLKVESDCITDENVALRAENTTLKVESDTIKDERDTFKDENTLLKDENTALKDVNKSLKDVNTSLKDNYATLLQEKFYLHKLSKDTETYMIKNHNDNHQLSILGSNIFQCQAMGIHIMYKDNKKSEEVYFTHPWIQFPLTDIPFQITKNNSNYSLTIDTEYIQNFKKLNFKYFTKNIQMFLLISVKKQIPVARFLFNDFKLSEINK